MTASNQAFRIVLYSSRSVKNTNNFHIRKNSQSINVTNSYISLNFRKNRLTRFIDDCIYLFDHIKICFVVCVFHATSAPRNCWQLPGRQRSADTTTNKQQNHTKFHQMIGVIIENYLDFPVTVLANVRKIFGGLMSSLRMLLSVANGKPLSSISSSNSYTTT